MKKLPEDALILGKSIGNSTRKESKARSYNLDDRRINRNKWNLKSYKENSDLKYYEDSHLMTIAPTGTGKGRSVIIPNLLTFTGPVIVIDPKGENYFVTAEAREKMGQDVYKLDPFGVVDGNSNGFNPLDIFYLANSDIDSDSQMLAELLSLEQAGFQDPFWDLSAKGLYSGVIGYIIKVMSKEKWNLNTLKDILMSDDPSLTLAKILDDKGKVITKMSYQEIASFLNMPSDKTRPSVVATAVSYIKSLMSGKVSKTISDSSFSINDIVVGKPISIYLIIPPDKLRSHSALLRLWVGTFLKAIMSRRHIPNKSTLFILDECAQLGYFSFLETIITLSRGYGLQAWTFWQDLSQIENLYKVAWSTMVNNCSVLQIFGTKNFSVASQCASLVGIDYNDVRGLAKDEQIVVIDGEALRLKKFDYLSDSIFAGKFNENPYYIYKNLDKKKK